MDVWLPFNKGPRSSTLNDTLGYLVLINRKKTDKMSIAL